MQYLTRDGWCLSVLGCRPVSREKFYEQVQFGKAASWMHDRGSLKFRHHPCANVLDGPLRHIEFASNRLVRTTVHDPHEYLALARAQCTFACPQHLQAVGGLPLSRVSTEGRPNGLGQFIFLAGRFENGNRVISCQANHIGYFEVFADDDDRQWHLVRLCQ